MPAVAHGPIYTGGRIFSQPGEEVVRREGAVSTKLNGISYELHVHLFLNIGHIAICPYKIINQFKRLDQNSSFARIP